MPPLAASLAALRVAGAATAAAPGPQLTPNTAVAKLLAPMLTAALHELEDSHAAAAPRAAADVGGSPAAFGGFNPLAPAATPAVGSDGVARNAGGWAAPSFWGWAG